MACGGHLPAIKFTGPTPAVGYSCETASSLSMVRSDHRLANGRAAARIMYGGYSHSAPAAADVMFG